MGRSSAKQPSSDGTFRGRRAATARGLLVGAAPRCIPGPLWGLGNPSGPLSPYAYRVLDLPGVAPLVILPGWLVRRWVRIPIEVELSTWSGERSELALRSSCWPTQPRWYFPAAAGALRTLAAEITAWAWAAGRCVFPPDVPRARPDEEGERGR